MTIKFPLLLGGFAPQHRSGWRPFGLPRACGQGSGYGGLRGFGSARRLKGGKLWVSPARTRCRKLQAWKRLGLRSRTCKRLKPYRNSTPTPAGAKDVCPLVYARAHLATPNREALRHTRRCLTQRAGGTETASLPGISRACRGLGVKARWSEWRERHSLSLEHGGRIPRCRSSPAGPQPPSGAAARHHSHWPSAAAVITVIGWIAGLWFTPEKPTH